MNPASTPISNPSKLEYVIKNNSEENESSYNFIALNNEENLTFTLEDLKDFPVKIYELKITFKELKEQDENFFVFRNAEKLMGGIKVCIESENYKVEYNKEENSAIFEMQNDFFENGVAKIKIPEKEQDLKTQVQCLTRVVAELRSELKRTKKDKEEAAINSFKGTSFLNEEEKKLISEWIDPKKIIKFYLLFATNKDGDSSSTFHYYCDGVFPTVTVVLDTSGRRFGGYSTQNWSQSTAGSGYSRGPCSFIFNLSNKNKYNLIDQFNTSAIYHYNSYGPTFGGGHDLFIANGCRSNTSSYCNKSSYDTGNNNLLGNSGSTSFQVSNYEVYKVVFE